MSVNHFDKMLTVKIIECIENFIVDNQDYFDNNNFHSQELFISMMSACLTSALYNILKKASRYDDTLMKKLMREIFTQYLDGFDENFSNKEEFVKPIN